MDKSGIIDGFKRNDERLIRSVYLDMRLPFIRFVLKNYRILFDEAREVYQESFYIFYDNILTGKLTDLRVDPLTYVIQVGRNNLNNKMKKDRKRQKDPESLLLQIPAEGRPEESEERIARISAVLRESLKKLGKPCYDLLMMFYFQKMRYEELMSKLEYANIDSLKSQKYKCFKRLQMEILSKYTMEDLLNS
jgi:DNA-directed RNA polymerase specialized sigma24 family protein